MSIQLLFVGVFFTMVGLILIFSQTPRVKLEQAQREVSRTPQPQEVLRPLDKIFAFDKIVVSQKNSPLNKELLGLDDSGGLWFYIVQTSSALMPLRFAIYANVTKQEELLRIQKDSLLQPVPTFSFYDADNKLFGQMEKDILSGRKSRWYLLNGNAERFAHVERDHEAVAWSQLSGEIRHSEKYDVFFGALVAGKFIRDEYDPDKYILDFSQDKGNFDRRIALGIAVVLMATAA